MTKNTSNQVHLEIAQDLIKALLLWEREGDYFTEAYNNTLKALEDQIELVRFKKVDEK